MKRIATLIVFISLVSCYGRFIQPSELDNYEYSRTFDLPGLPKNKIHKLSEEWLTLKKNEISPQYSNQEEGILKAKYTYNYFNISTGIEYQVIIDIFITIISKDGQSQIIIKNIRATNPGGLTMYVRKKDFPKIQGKIASIVTSYETYLLNKKPLGQ
jgi:hypothetical protein